MDTKSKSSSLTGAKLVLFAALACLLVAAVCASMMPRTFERAAEETKTYYDQEFFVKDLYRISLAQYWRLQQAEVGSALTAVEVFFPESAQRLNWLKWMEQDGLMEEGEREELQRLERFAEECGRTVSEWQDLLQGDLDDMEYLVANRRGTQFGYTTSAELEALADGVSGEAPAQLRSDYQYYAALRFDGRGDLHVDALYGGTRAALQSLQDINAYRFWRDEMDYMGNDYFPYAIYQEIGTPQNMTVVFAVPEAERGRWSYIAWRAKNYEQRALHGNAETQMLYYLPMGLAALLAAVCSLCNRKRPTILDKLPCELSVAAVIAAVLLHEETAMLANIYLHVSATPGGMGMFLPAFVFLAGMMALLFAGTYSLFRVFAVGPRRYIGECSLCGRAVTGCFRLLRRGVRWMSEIDLTEPGEKTVLKIVALNFVVLTVLCALWVFGIVGLLIYSVALYVILRRYLRGLKQKFQVLLQAAGAMAAGRLDAPIEGDLGLFQPLASELREVQKGFRKAVDAEVRSRSMKTELVANVSHDLKTPLTAIITYVDLLKNEEITEEERRSYIETLDSKSQRLGRLIEDLFEVSKATSGNVTMEPVPVDLPSLIRQVELEMGDVIEASGISLHTRSSVERVSVLLDGEKTSRVFENLILNVTKYAMPGTRAYIDLAVRGEYVVVKINNVSREPLEFEGRDITERFVRGDRSRGTEGSGLGLAIAKSFVELQRGRLTVATEGDLFKVMLVFPVYHPPEYGQQTHQPESADGTEVKAGPDA